MANVKPIKLGVLVAVLLALVGTSFWLIGPKKRVSSRPNLILVSIDTLRADRLGAYRYQRETTPFLDSFAAQSALFEHAIAPASWTLPSHVSLFTGLYPSSHGVNSAQDLGIGAGTEILTETLKQAGYRTFAYTGGGYVNKRYGFGRGFEDYQKTKNDNQRDERGFLAALHTAHDRVQALPDGDPYFLFLHTYAVHCPYVPSEPYATMFRSPGAEKINSGLCGPQYSKMKDLSKGQALFLSDRYDGSIRLVDTNLKEFVDGMRADGLLENTYIVITSDHGEEFLEHGQVGHENSLHRELLMVPLLIAGPGIQARRMQEPVSLVDIYPTILDLLGLPASAQPEGRSVAAVLRGAPEVSLRPFQLSELSRGKSLRSFFNPIGEHLIADLDQKSVQLFDVQTDPGEQQNLAMERAERAEAIRKQAEEFVAGLAVKETSPIEDSTTDEHVKQLKTLGYM